MHTGEWELGFGVIEHRRNPSVRTVANSASRGDTGRSVVGIGRLVVVSDVARGAVRRRAGKFPVDVARRAGHVGMHSRKRELGSGVIEFGSAPGGRRVTGCALARKTSL